MKNDEQIIIPIDRYNSLLKKEEIFDENSIQVTFFTSDWRLLNLIWFKGDDAQKEMVKQLQEAYKIKIKTERELLSLHKEFATIKSKWWYKLLN